MWSNPVGDNHNYNTRSRGDIALNSHRLELYKKKPTYIGSKFYNKLPQDFRSIGGQKEFKNKLKKFLISRALYSLEELWLFFFLFVLFNCLKLVNLLYSYYLYHRSDTIHVYLNVYFMNKDVLNWIELNLLIHCSKLGDRNLVLKFSITVIAE